MLEIITEQGISLDLVQGTEFQLEMEQPLLSNDHIPAPFSTAISFPPSMKNREVFGYYPLPLAIPSVKTLPVHICISGARIISGILEFDGIDDGLLQYSFTAKVISDKWNESISVSGSLVFPDAFYGGDAAAPLIINESAVTDHIYGNSGSVALVSPDVKYRNYPVSYSRFVCPALKMTPLLQRIGALSFLDIQFPGNLLDEIAVLCRTGNTAVSGTGPGGMSLTDEMAPDITGSDLLAGLAKIICAGVYSVPGGGLTVVTSRRIMADAAEDWQGKVSSLCSLYREKPVNYKFGFSNSSDSDTFDLGTSSENLEELSNYYSLRAKGLALPGEYQTFKISRTGDYVSSRGARAHSDCEIDADVVQRNFAPAKNDVGADSSFDNSVPFIVPRTVPAVIDMPDSGMSWVMAPVVPALNADSARDGDVYVGLLRAYEGGEDEEENPPYLVQFTDHGVYFSSPDSEYPSNDGGLRPAFLFEKYHKAFAGWLGSERTSVKADLKLSPLEISRIKMYRPVYFHGRRWLIKKLSVIFKAGSGLVSAEGEFISL